MTQDCTALNGKLEIFNAHNTYLKTEINKLLLKYEDENNERIQEILKTPEVVKQNHFVCECFSFTNLQCDVLLFSCMFIILPKYVWSYVRKCFFKTCKRKNYVFLFVIIFTNLLNCRHKLPYLERISQNIRKHYWNSGCRYLYQYFLNKFFDNLQIDDYLTFHFRKSTVSRTRRKIFSTRRIFKRRKRWRNAHWNV